MTLKGTDDLNVCHYLLTLIAVPNIYPIFPQLFFLMNLNVIATLYNISSYEKTKTKKVTW